MAKAVRWTPKAIHTYIDVLNWLRTSWTTKEEDRFVNDVEKTIRYIVKFPRGFRSAAMPGFERLLSNHTISFCTESTPRPLSSLACSTCAGILKHCVH